MWKAWLVSVAATIGVFAGHQVTYERAAEAAGSHAGMTMATQSWLPSLPAILAVVSLVALALTALYRKAPSALTRPKVVLGVQSLAFVSIEVADRAINGCCLYPSLPVAAAGLIAQALPAFLVYTLIAVAAPRLLRALTCRLCSMSVPARTALRVPAEPVRLHASTFNHFLPSRAPPIAA